MTEERFVHELLRCRAPLQAFLLALTGDPDLADDLFQQGAVVMTRKRPELPEDAPFLPWARQVLLFEVQDHRKKQARQRLQFLDGAILDQVAHAFEAPEPELPPVREALRHCLEKLDPPQRELLRRRYDARQSYAALAKEYQRDRNALEAQVYRLRRVLESCVKGRLRTPEARP